jgi:hypothetical protein
MSPAKKQQEAKDDRELELSVIHVAQCPDQWLNKVVHFLSRIACCHFHKFTRFYSLLG